jgi:hypothetical protein
MNPQANIDNGICQDSDDENDTVQSDVLTTLNQDLINNIFCPNIDYINARLGNNFSKDNIYKEFGNVYIACLKNTTEYKPHFFQNQITTTEYASLLSSVDIIQTTNKIISIDTIKYLTILPSHIFNSMNILDQYNNKIETSKDILLCCMLRFRYSNIMSYLKQFDGICTFIDIYNSLLINEYLGQKNRTSNIKQNHIIMISNMNESNYYTIDTNCQLNISIKFKERTFNISFDRLSDTNIQNICKQITSSNDDTDYLALLFQKASYIDASVGIKSSGYHYYRISNSQLVNTMTNYDFNQMYQKLGNAEKYYLIMNCMISKDLCHLIINNKFILEQILSTNKDKSELTFMNKYAQLIRYLIGYAWLSFYMEESIKRSFITKKDRFVFEIDTACLLPYYPYSIENLHICPYLPVLVNNQLLNPAQNILGIEQILIKNNNLHNQKLCRYGITDINTFQERINIFVSGKNDNNILNNINWSNIAISGSIMACCLPNFNTLMMHFASIDSTSSNISIDFNKYVQEYYKDADIDVMCNILDMYEFVDKIHEFKSTIDTNIKKINNLTTDINITNIFSNKSAVIMINEQFIRKNILNKLDMDYNMIILNLNKSPVKEIIYTHYIEWHKEYLKKSANENIKNFINPKYIELYNIIQIDYIKIILTKIISLNILEENDELFMPKINFKFRIESVYLPHKFELFQIKKDFMASVARFHLPIVRSYYDGLTVYITPSCISACMTLLNIDYKYFAGSNDPIEIINKYRYRGFGTILNNNEIMRLIEYSNLVPKWKKLYGLNIGSTDSISKILGILNLNSTLSKPCKIFNNNYLEIYNQIATPISKLSQNDLIEQIQQLYKTSDMNIVNMAHIYTINNYGYVDPVKKWLLNVFYDIKTHYVEEIN